jgi:hypothetical protein
MPLAHAMFIHGHSLVVENPERVSQTITGSRIRIVGDPDTTNWLHLAIPTPVWVEDMRLRIGSAVIRYRAHDGATITKFNIYDGETLIAEHERLLDASDYSTERFYVHRSPQIHRGVGISIKVAFGSARRRRQVDISSAGAYFIVHRV